MTASFRQAAAAGSLLVAPANLLHALYLSLLLDAWTRAIGCRANCQGHASPAVFVCCVLQLVEQEADELVAKYGTPRRTAIVADSALGACSFGRPALATVQLQQGRPGLHAPFCLWPYLS